MSRKNWRIVARKMYSQLIGPLSDDPEYANRMAIEVFRNAEGVTNKDETRCAAITQDAWYKAEKKMRCKHRASVGRFCKKHAKPRRAAQGKEQGT